MSQLEKNYAEALFQISLEEGKLEEIHILSKKVVKLLEENKQFEELLSNAFLDKKERHKIIDNVFKNQVDDLFLHFLHVINDNGRMSHLVKILKEINSLCNEHFNVLEGICYTSFKMSDEQLSQLMNALSLKEGKQVYLVNRINKDLIGGVKIIIGDRVYDSSVLTTIESIRKNLLNK